MPVINLHSLIKLSLKYHQKLIELHAIYLIWDHFLLRTPIRGC